MYKSILQSKKIKKFIDFNKSFLNKPKSDGSEILVEFNAFQPFHVQLSVLINYLNIKNSSSYVAFFNYALVVSPLREGFIQKIKWLIGKYFKLKTFQIYSSLGVSKYIKPDLNNSFKEKVLFNYERIIKNTKQEEITRIKINNILIGDLLNDSYIKYFKTYTVDIKSKKFKNYLMEFLYLYFYWENYFDRHKVKCVIGVHHVYAYGIPFRIAINKKIKSIIINHGQLYSLSIKRPYANCEYLDFKKKFSKLSAFQKKKALLLSEKILKNRFDGKLSSKMGDFIYSRSAFNSTPIKKKKTKKFKVLIVAHEVHDAPSLIGQNFFSDFYIWMEFIMRLSKFTNFEWYLKNHPRQKQMKLNRNQDLTENVTDMLLKKYPNIKKIPSNMSHNEIISNGIDVALTVRGTVAFEYAYLNIPVVLASTNNTTKFYSFNKQVLNKSSYKKIILNLDKLNIKINKKEVLEYYFMRYVFNNPNYLLPFFLEYRAKFKNFDKYYTSDFYEYFVNEKKNNKKMIYDINLALEKFFLKNSYVLDKDHSNNVFEKFVEKINKF